MTVGPTKRFEPTRRLTMGDALGLPKVRATMDVRAAMNAGGKPGDVPTFVPDGTPLPKDSPRDERGQPRTFGEQFVALLGEFMDARERSANQDDTNKAAARLQAFLDKRLP